MVLFEDAAAKGLRRRVVHLESVVLHRAVRHEPLMRRNARESYFYRSHSLFAEWIIEYSSLDPNVVVGAPHRRRDQGDVAAELSEQGRIRSVAISGEEIREDFRANSLLFSYDV